MLQVVIVSPSNQCFCGTRAVTRRRLLGEGYYLQLPVKTPLTYEERALRREEGTRGDTGK